MKFPAENVNCNLVSISASVLLRGEKGGFDDYRLKNLKTETFLNNETFFPQ